MQTTNLLSLPQELLIDVFNKLSLRDVLSVSSVCKKLYQVGQKEDIWKPIIFSTLSISKLSFACFIIILSIIHPSVCPTPLEVMFSELGFMREEEEPAFTERTYSDSFNTYKSKKSGLSLAVNFLKDYENSKYFLEFILSEPKLLCSLIWNRDSNENFAASENFLVCVFTALKTIHQGFEHVLEGKTPQGLPLRDSFEIRFPDIRIIHHFQNIMVLYQRLLKEDHEHILEHRIQHPLEAQIRSSNDSMFKTRFNPLDFLPSLDLYETTDIERESHSNGIRKPHSLIRELVKYLLSRIDLGLQVKEDEVKSRISPFVKIFYAIGSLGELEILYLLHRRVLSVFFALLMENSPYSQIPCLDPTMPPDPLIHELLGNLFNCCYIDESSLSHNPFQIKYMPRLPAQDAEIIASSSFWKSLFTKYAKISDLMIHYSWENRQRTTWLLRLFLQHFDQHINEENCDYFLRTVSGLMSLGDSLITARLEILLNPEVLQEANVSLWAIAFRQKSVDKQLTKWILEDIAKFAAKFGAVRIYCLQTKDKWWTFWGDFIMKKTNLAEKMKDLIGN